MLKSNAMYLLFIVAFAVSCAESHEGEPEDTETGSDTDTDSDTDIDTDSDTDTDTECECSNATQPCCDGCNYYGTDHVCEPEAEEVLTCGAEPSCGDIVLAKFRQRYCTGDQGLCAGDLGDELADGGVAEECGDNETCESSADAGTAECGIDLVTCPVGFGDRFCQAGGTLAECGSIYFECTTPTTHDEVVEVADFGVGEVVKLEITTDDRMGSAFLPQYPFSDITMTVEHDGTVASVYNGYRGDPFGTEDYHFPGVWYLPQFAGEMGGEWTIHFEDSIFTGPPATPFPITEWCVTFLDPATTTPLTEGEWAATDVGLVSGAAYGSETYSSFEMQIDAIVDASGQTPWLELDVTPADANVQIDLVGPDGSVIEVKSMYETDVPSAVLLEDLATTWLTGRWALRVTEYTFGVATVNAWSIHLGDEPPVTDGGVDGGVDSGT